MLELACRVGEGRRACTAQRREKEKEKEPLRHARSEYSQGRRRGGAVQTCLCHISVEFNTQLPLELIPSTNGASYEAVHKS